MFMKCRACSNDATLPTKAGQCQCNGNAFHVDIFVPESQPPNVAAPTYGNTPLMRRCDEYQGVSELLSKATQEDSQTYELLANR